MVLLLLHRHIEHRRGVIIIIIIAAAKCVTVIAINDELEFADVSSKWTSK